MARRKSAAKRALACALAALAVAAIGARIAYVHAPDPGAPAAQEQAPAPDAGESDERAPRGIGDAAPLDTLTERQRELLAAYGPEERDLIDRLRSASWQTFDSQRNVHWSENTFAEVDLAAGSEAEPVTYAVAALSRATQMTSGATTETVTAVLECGDGRTRIIVLGKTTEADGSEVEVVSSDDFKVATSYLKAERASSVEVAGMTEQMRGLIGGDEEGLARALTEYCAVHLPAASKATWEQVATIDEGAGTVAFSMMLDTSDSPSVAVMYDRATGAFEVGRSR